MTDSTIRCLCPHCSTKYRLPAEFQGRTAKCKKCGQGFQVPQERSLEDSVLDWLSEPEAEDQEVEKPRVISMPKDSISAADSDASKRAKGPIRLKAKSE